MFFWELLGGKRHGAPFLGLGGGDMVGLPPWIRQCVRMDIGRDEKPGTFGKLWLQLSASGRYSGSGNTGSD